MANITSVAVQNQRTLRVTFDAAVAGAAIGVKNTLANMVFEPWCVRVIPANLEALPNIVNKVTPVGTSGSGTYTQFDLNCEPGLTPNVDYYLEFGLGHLLDAAGHHCKGSTTVAVPLTNVSTSKEWVQKHGPLRAITRAFGQELFSVGGTPRTVLTRDWNPGDPVLYVESNIDFDKGPMFDYAVAQMQYFRTGSATYKDSVVWPPETGATAVLIDGRRFWYTWVDP